MLLTRDPIGPALFIHPARILTRAPVASMYTWPISIGGSLLCTGRQLFSLQYCRICTYVDMYMSVANYLM
jgi:hypothetical protein